jgi:hypothetical protein
MSRSAADLPEDPVELRRFAAALAAEVHAKTLLIEKLRMQLSILRRARFGRSSEKLDREIEQLELLLGDIEEGDAERQATPSLSVGFKRRDGALITNTLGSPSGPKSRLNVAHASPRLPYGDVTHSNGPPVVARAGRAALKISASGLRAASAVHQKATSSAMNPTAVAPRMVR